MADKELTAFAIVAHPDDVEFMMAGTLLLLKDAGVDIHLWNLCNGCYGSMVYRYDDIKRIRWEKWKWRRVRRARRKRLPERRKWMAEVRQRQLELGEPAGFGDNFFRTRIGGDAGGRSGRFSKPAAWRDLNGIRRHWHIGGAGLHCRVYRAGRRLE